MNAWTAFGDEGIHDGRGAAELLPNRSSAWTRPGWPYVAHLIMQDSILVAAEFTSTNERFEVKAGRHHRYAGLIGGEASRGGTLQYRLGTGSFSEGALLADRELIPWRDWDREEWVTGGVGVRIAAGQLSFYGQCRETQSDVVRTEISFQS